MTTKPKRESYRVTIVRPEGVKVEQVRLWITEGLNAHDSIEAKVELIRASHPDATPKSFWQRLFHA